MANFIIKPGIHNVPNHGRVDCNKTLDETLQVKLYLEPNFRHFITPTKSGIALLKKQKPTDQELAKLLLHAKTVDEVEWLLDIKSTKPLKAIAETRIKALQLQ